MNSNQHLGYEQIEAAASAIRDRLGVAQGQIVAPVGVVLGSGLGSFAERISVRALPYDDIVHFPKSSVVGHQGRLHLAKLGDTPLLAMQGRVHRYEGYNASEVVFGVRVLAALGVQSLVLTNAAGGINTAFKPGDLMLISDHINLSGDNPQLGPNDDRLGSRFFDMGDAYSASARALTQSIAKREGLSLHEGVYAGVLGPSYETPAEIRMMRALGADAVGMSTVLETIAARHRGLQVVGLSCITNMAAGITANTLHHDEVTEVARVASDRFQRLLCALIPELAKIGKNA